MTVYGYQFECTLLVKKILKAAKKHGVKKAFKEGFEFQDQYYIGLEKFGIEKIDDEDDLFIESLSGEFWRIPLRKGGPKKGLSWWPDNSQVPNKEAVKVLKDLYAFIKA